MERITIGQFGEMIALFAKKLPLTMLKGTAQEWIDNPTAFESVIAHALMSKASATSETQFPDEVLKQIGSWGNFYKKFFGIDMDFSEVKIPEKIEGFDRLIVIAKGIRLNQVWNVHEERDIPRWQWWTGSLEKAMQESERGPVKQTYAIWVRDEQEAIDVDEKLLKELSAEVIAERKIDTENLLERLIHGLKYFDETGNHLDIKGVTLCACSRSADGTVPRVYRSDDGGVSVRRYSVGSSNPDFRARRAVR